MSQALAGSRTKPSLGVQVDYSHPFASGLVGCYLFNEGGGRVAHDLSPYANHGLATAAPIWIKGTADSGVYLDTNYYFDCGSRDSQGLPRGLTILAACTIDNLANYRNLIWRQAPAGTGYGMICWGDGQLRLQDATTDVTASTLAINTDYILGYTNAASNGSGGASNSKIGYTWSRAGGLSVVAGSGSLNAAGSGTYYTSIGKDHTNNRPWRGNLYWLYMWNRPLVKSDIQRIISEPYCFFQSKPVAVRRFASFTMPTHATSAATAHSATTPKTASAGTRTAGDLVVVLIQQVSAGSNTYTVSDDQGNSYTKLAEKTSSDNRYVAVYYSVITTGGSVTTSVAATGGINYGFTVCAATPPSGKVIAADTSSSFEDASTTTSHNLGAVGAIDTTTDVIVYGATLTTGNTGTVTDPSGFTLTQTVLSQRGFAWRRESAATLTDERGSWASANNTVSTGIIASFKAVVAATFKPAWALKTQRVIGGGVI